MRRVALASFVLVTGASLAMLAAQAPGQVDLGSAGLRAVNRDAKVQRGAGTASAPVVHVSAGPGNGVVWIEGTDFSEGAIDVEVRGKDVLQQSFVGVAFHRKDDNAYEAVYLRPFNFRVDDPARRQRAVQYIALPEFDWPRLRQEFADEFENPVDASVSPTDWVPLKIVVRGPRIQIFVGRVTTPALDVRKLGTLTSGQIGLWVGNTSDGEFRNLRTTP
jgi:hypothetical protein